MTEKEINDILERLNKKANSSYNDKIRMPSVKQISKLLTAYGIKHYVSETTNIVEYRSKGNRYVNSRHSGKSGRSLEIPDIRLELDTSHSYYSFNTWNYARQITDLIKSVTDKTKS